MDDIFKKALNNPPHLFRADAIYMITASTYQSKPLIRTGERKSQWRDAFLKSANLYQWPVIAWVVLDNHYHTLVEAPDSALSLSKFIGACHKFTSKQWNEADRTPGRKVWWNYWDSCIRSEKDYFNRLKYVFWNPVKHGLADHPANYEFCNYKDFLAQHYGLDFDNTQEVNDVPEF